MDKQQKDKQAKQAGQQNSKDGIGGDKQNQNPMPEQFGFDENQKKQRMAAQQEYNQNPAMQQQNMVPEEMSGPGNFEQSLSAQSAAQFMQQQQFNLHQPMQQMQYGADKMEQQFMNQGMPMGPMGQPQPGHQQFQQTQGPTDPEEIAHIQELQAKFEKIRADIDKTPSDINSFKQQSLPLARIKKIMKSDEDVRMISSEAPILFALACQMFITEITHKAAFYAKKQARKTLQRNDVARVIANNETFDFLLDVIPREEIPQGVPLSSNQKQLLEDCARMKTLGTFQDDGQMQHIKGGASEGVENSELEGQQADSDAIEDEDDELDFNGSDEEEIKAKSKSAKKKNRV